MAVQANAQSGQLWAFEIGRVLEALEPWRTSKQYHNPPARSQATKLTTLRRRVRSLLGRPAASPGRRRAVGEALRLDEDEQPVQQASLHGPGVVRERADEAAWPSQSTLAEMTGIHPRGVRKATKQLEAAGLIRVEKGGGDKSTRYWLTPALRASLPRPSEPDTPALRASLPRPSEPDTPALRASEVPNEGTSTRKAAALPVLLNSQGPDEKPQAETKPDRVTCPKCGNDWPSRCGTTCYTKGCGWKRSTSFWRFCTGSWEIRWSLGRACRHATAGPTTDETCDAARTRSDARANGYTLVAGTWMKLL